jgi:lysophospholipase L1-like esterase
MLIHDNLAFHNVAELVPAPGGGLHLARFPKAIWPQAEAASGGNTIRSSNGCEIRFVTDHPSARIYLRPLLGDADIVHYRGNHVSGYQTLESGKITCLDLTFPKLEANRARTVRALGGYAPEVSRIYSQGATLSYHGMDAMGGNLRPPTTEELPSRRWLAYGSSITQSSGTAHSYVNGAAQMLQAQPYNLGMGGSCVVEPAIADFIASRDDWDFATFELGINMVTPSRDNARYAEKINYLLDAVTARQPGKPIFLITIFDHGTFHEIEPSDWQRDASEKDQILRTAAARFPEQVTLLEGTDIVPDLRGFQVDLLHPEPFAYARMALRLADAIEPVLQKAEPHIN